MSPKHATASSPLLSVCPALLLEIPSFMALLSSQTAVLDSLEASPILGFDHKKGIKELAESGILDSLPADYMFVQESTHLTDDPVVEEHIPIVDFSLLQSENPEERSQAIHDLGRACADWGFFMLINHGIRESLKKDMLDALQDFFDLSPDEKVQYAGKHVLDPIRYGTSFNTSVDKVLYWRDFLKVFLHPESHSPEKPLGFREVAEEYCRNLREVAGKLLNGISESLGLDNRYIERAVQLDDGFQILIGNFYPRCPQPDLAIGLPPHSDHGLLTILLENSVSGLQVKHNGKWVYVKSAPNSFLVNTGDHMEVLSNGRYKSVEHQATVNSECARMSIAVAHGPSLDAVISPAQELVDVSQTNHQIYREMKYREYIEFQQSNRLVGKACLNMVRASPFKI